MSGFIDSFFRRSVDLGISGSGKDEEPSGKKCPPPDSDPFGNPDFRRNFVRLSMSDQFAAGRKWPYKEFSLKVVAIRLRAADDVDIYGHEQLNLRLNFSGRDKQAVSRITT
jgi:hypothetical protein